MLFPVHKCLYPNALFCNHHMGLLWIFLYMLHQPPPPHITTISSYAKYLWDRIVIKLGTQRGANVIRISQHTYQSLGIYCMRIDQVKLEN